MFVHGVSEEVELQLIGIVNTLELQIGVEKVDYAEDGAIVELSEDFQPGLEAVPVAGVQHLVEPRRVFRIVVPIRYEQSTRRSRQISVDQ